MDLLQRHQERHHEPGKISAQGSVSSPEDSPDPPQTSRSDSLASQTTTTTEVPFLPADHTFYTPPQPMTPMHEPATLPSQTKYHSSRVGQHLAAVSMAVEGMVPGLWNDSYSQSPSYTSSDGYPSPIPGSNDFSTMILHMAYCPEPSNRTRASSITSFVDPSWSYVSHSPVSPTSAMAYPWVPNEKAPNAPDAPAYMMSALYPMTSMPMTGYEAFNPTTMMQRDEQENVILFGEQPYDSFIPLTPSSIDLPFDA